MSVDISAILEHRLSFSEIVALPAVLNSDAQLREASVALQKSWLQRPTATGEMDWKIERDPLWQSAEEEWNHTGYLSLNETNGLGLLYVHRSAAEFHPLVRWSAFLEYPHLREPIRSACAAIIRRLRGSQCIYLQDSGPHEMASDMVSAGESIAPIWSYVRRKFGEPRSDYELGANWPENAYGAECF